MIQIDALFLCSAARPDPASGLLIILGAGGNAFQSPIGFPAPILPTCVLLFSADGTDFGTRHEIEIAIVGSDGPSEGPTTFDWTVEKPADYIAGMRIVRWEHSSLDRYTAPSPGLYRIDCRVDGKTERELTFLVR